MLKKRANECPYRRDPINFGVPKLKPEELRTAGHQRVRNKGSINVATPCQGKRHEEREEEHEPPVGPPRVCNMLWPRG